MGPRRLLILLVLAGALVAPRAAQAQGTPSKLASAKDAAAKAANASSTSTGGAVAAAPAPAATGGSEPSAPMDDASKVQAEGKAVVDQILKDKEDLLSGKRFSYDPGGRRDPFRSLLEQVSSRKGPRPKGIAGMLIGEVDLVGTVRDPKGNVAFFKGSDNKGYFLHVGDEIYDGQIMAIDPSSGTVTFRQHVDDPRQIKPYRDIVKRLTPLTEEEAQ